MLVSAVQRSRSAMRAKSLSRVRLFVTPWTVARRLLCPWDSPGKNTGVGCHAVLLGIFPTQRLNSRIAGGFSTTGPPGKPYTPPSWASLTSPGPHPSRSSESTEPSSLCYPAAFHWLSVLHVVVCACQSWSPNHPTPLPPHPREHTWVLHFCDPPFFWSTNRGSTHTHRYIHICIHTYMYTHIYVCVCVCVCVCLLRQTPFLKKLTARFLTKNSILQMK